MIARANNIVAQQGWSDQISLMRQQITLQTGKQNRGKNASIKKSVVKLLSEVCSFHFLKL